MRPEARAGREGDVDCDVDGDGDVDGDVDSDVDVMMTRRYPLVNTWD